jgi:preprotein translocase subunit SecE
MAQRRKNKKPKVVEADRPEETEEPSAGGTSPDEALARAGDDGEADEASEPSDDAEASGEDQADEEDDAAEGDRAEGDDAGPDELLAASAEGEEGDDEQAAAQLGSERYVLAGFFAVGMIGAYILGRAIQAVWMGASNKTWFSQAVPWLAAVQEDEKGSISLALGAVVALVLVVRTYRKPEVRAWTDGVAAELAKVVWPTRKEVWNSTVIVIAASTVATVYLALLDRLWAFITNIVYGDGS